MFISSAHTGWGEEGFLGGVEFNIYCRAASISHFFFFFQASGLQSTENLMHLPDSAESWRSYFIFTSGKNEGMAGGGKLLLESLKKKKKKMKETQKKKNCCFTSIHMIRRCSRYFFKYTWIWNESIKVERVTNGHFSKCSSQLRKRRPLLSQRIAEIWLHDVEDACRKKA